MNVKYITLEIAQDNQIYYICVVLFGNDIVVQYFL